MRLIDMDAERERLKKGYCEECTRKGNYGIFGAACTPCWVKDAIEEFDNAQTVEAEPVRHGRWKKKNLEIYCTNCKKSKWSESFELLLRGFDFCPKCGARMVGGADNAG